VNTRYLIVVAVMTGMLVAAMTGTLVAAMALATTVSPMVPSPILPSLQLPSPSVVGAPELTFTYSGLGTSRYIYAQLVDDQTGLVLGNLVTPVPVILDGSTHTISIPLEGIGYTISPGDQLELAITSSAALISDLEYIGRIQPQHLDVQLPPPSQLAITSSAPVDGGA
jgi:hypothetical protein